MKKETSLVTFVASILCICMIGSLAILGADSVDVKRAASETNGMEHERAFFLDARSYKDYKELVKQKDPDKKLISYDDVSFLGKFDAFIVPYDPNDIPVYWMDFGERRLVIYDLDFYNLIYSRENQTDAGDYRHNLSLLYGIENLFEGGTEQLSRNEIHPSDMSRARTDCTGTYTHKGIKYRFDHGQLREVQWENDNHCFILQVSKAGASRDSIFVNALLNLNTAQKAVSFFNMHV